MKKIGFRVIVVSALTFSLVLIMSAAVFAAPVTKNIRIITKSAGKAHDFNRGMKGDNWL